MADAIDAADVAASSAPPRDEDELGTLEAQLYGTGEDGEVDSDDNEVMKSCRGHIHWEGEGQEAGAGQAAGGQPMTKSQMKKSRRLERMIASRAAARLREKAAKAQRRSEANERKAAELAGMTEEQKQAMREEKQVKLQALKEQERQLKERLKQSLEVGPRIVIDLDFEEQMTESDIRHLVQQLGFSYSANKQVERPAHLFFTSFKGAVAAAGNRMLPGMENWFVTRTEQHYNEVFGSAEDKSSLVYLTADSNEELEELDDTKIYIVGGLVDHNRYKGLCERQARAAGVATARLPIARHIQLASRAVLTVNHVVQILIEQLNRKDWAVVLDQVLPLRKRADYAAQQQQQQRQAKGQEEAKGAAGPSKGAAKAARKEQGAAGAAAAGVSEGAPADAAAADGQGTADAAAASSSACAPSEAAAADGQGVAGGAAQATGEAAAAEAQGVVAERGVKRKAEDEADGAGGGGEAKLVVKEEGAVVKQE